MGISWVDWVDMGGGELRKLLRLLRLGLRKLLRLLSGTNETILDVLWGGVI